MIVKGFKRQNMYNIVKHFNEAVFLTQRKLLCHHSYSPQPDHKVICTSANHNAKQTGCHVKVYARPQHQHGEKQLILW